MRTGRVVFGQTENGLQIGQVSEIKGEEGLVVTVNKAGDTVLLTPGNAHKFDPYKIGEFLNTIEISKPDFVVGDPVLHTKDGRIGKVETVGKSTMNVAFGTTVGTAKRLKTADLINLRDKLDSLESMVTETIGLPQGEESVPSPLKPAYAMGESESEEEPYDEGENEGYDEEDE